MPRNPRLSTRLTAVEDDPCLTAPSDVAAWISARRLLGERTVYSLHLDAVRRLQCVARLACCLAAVVDDPAWAIESAQACRSASVVLVETRPGWPEPPSLAVRAGWHELRARHALAGVRALDLVLVSRLEWWSLGGDGWPSSGP